MYVESLLKLILVIAVILSFYIFITTVVTKEKKYKHLFTTWQFPMLFAICLDVFFIGIL